MAQSTRSNDAGGAQNFTSTSGQEHAGASSTSAADAGNPGTAAYGADNPQPQYGATSAAASRLGATENSAAKSQTAEASNADNDYTRQIRVLRASDFIGTDVISADGRKVGDIVDFVFDTKAPRLDYVIVMTGGFLDVGGTRRAVPAQAMTLQGDAAHLQITRDQFNAVPKLPGDRDRYFKDENNVAALDHAFHLKADQSAADRGPLLSYSDFEAQRCVLPAKRTAGVH